MSRSRVSRQDGEMADARAHLSGVYERFNEGFRTERPCLAQALLSGIPASEVGALTPAVARER